MNSISNLLVSTELEQMILGAILKDADKAKEVVSLGVKPESFYVGQHQDIYSAIHELLGRDINPDVIEVMEFLERKKKNRKGTFDYLTELVVNGFAANMESYSALLLEKAKRRNFIDVFRYASDLIKTGVDPSTNVPVEDVFSRVESLLTNLDNDSAKRGFVHIDDALHKAVDVLDKKFHGEFDTGLKTGYSAIDYRLNGVNGLWLVGARPSMGKTAYVLNILRKVALKEKQLENPGVILSFNLEMSNLQVINRLLSAQGKIKSGLIKSGLVLNSEKCPGEQQKLLTAATALKGMPVYLNEDPNLNVFDICSLVRAKARRQKVALVVVDYLGLIESTNHVSSKADQVGEITRKLKMLNIEIDVPVLLVSQLNRDVDKRKNKRPMLSDLRDSGAVEQDADIVQFLYREGYYNPESDHSDQVEVITAKLRDGEVGTDYLSFLTDYGLMESNMQRDTENNGDFEFTED